MLCSEMSDWLADYDIPDELLDLISELEMTFNVSQTHLFGGFDDHRISVMEHGVTDQRCFLSIKDWGVILPWEARSFIPQDAMRRQASLSVIH